jgi:phage terminase large subunit-like protein
LQSMAESEEFRSSLAEASAAVQAQARYRWDVWARPNQIEPDGDHRYWLILAGRGFGKTRAGVEWVRSQIENGSSSRAIVIAPTSADCRDTVVDGPSGFLNVCPPWNRPLYEPSKRRLTWDNGAVVSLYSAEEPDRLRGVNCDLMLADELAAWTHSETWDMAMFALRIGVNPRAMITTTPRPTRLIKNLVENTSTVVTRGSTYDNKANLAPQFLDAILKKYDGTRMGRQEIYAEVLEDVEGAILSLDQLISLRVEEADDPQRIVVGVDPAISTGENADKTGIVVTSRGKDGHLYALADRSCRLGPAGWAKKVVDAFHEFQADLIVAEKNQGGAMVEHTIRSLDADVPIKLVHATRGKHVRAEPILAMFEQGKAHTMKGMDELESQLSSFTPQGYESDGSPDSADAFIWASTELTQDRGAQIFL